MPDEMFTAEKFSSPGEDYVLHMHMWSAKNFGSMDQSSSSMSRRSTQQRPDETLQVLGVPTYMTSHDV